MNTPSPLVPQGATPPRANSGFYVKFLMIVAVHVVVIGGMLLQGCRDTAKDPANNNNPLSDNNPAVTNPANTPPAPTTSVDVPPPLNPTVNNTVPGPAVTPGSATQTQPSLTAEPPKVTPEVLPPTTGEKDYVIVEGDRLAAIAHKNGVTLKALMEANPGINPTKLQIKQTIHIPASIAVAAAAHGAGANPASTMDAAADSALYTVKSGDVLLRIAKTHGTTVKKIMAMNDLKTTSIRAGQKLKLPAAAAAPSAPSVTAPATAAAPTATPTVTRVSATPTPMAAN